MTTNTTVEPTKTIETDVRLHTARPSFFGLVRGELFKSRRQWSTWLMLVLFTGAIFLPYLVMFIESDIKQVILASGTDYVYSRVAMGLALIRIFGGFFVLILTANVIGREYQLGTIRVILARGVGRVQLLLAKLAAIVIWAVIITLIGLVLNALLALLQVQVITGNLQAITGLDSSVWHDLGVYVLTVLVSLGATILMATAVTVLFRSLAGGLSLAIAWFPVDNIATVILTIAFALTKNDFWQNISAYLLGPNLNVMASAVSGIRRGAWAFGQAPLVQVDGTHTLVVTAVYSAIFLAFALFLTWKRDVKE
jgi:ABC-2 type transport system permease protein